MDNSKTYIKMCNCAEVQEKYVIESRNFHGCTKCLEVTNLDYTGCPVCSCKTIVNGSCFAQVIPDDAYHIWLPRQDQLQEIIGQYYALQDEIVYSSFYIEAAFLCFVAWMNEQYCDEAYVCVPTNVFDSGEKLWLAFVMEEKFGKRWLDDKWESI